MVVAARTFEGEISVEELTIRLLEQKVEHIQSDVSETKSDIRRLDAKIENNRDTIADVKDSVATLRVEMKDGFGAANQKFSELTAAIVVLDGKFERLDEKTDVSDRTFEEKTDALGRRIDDRFTTLDRKIDDRFTVLDRKIDDRFTVLDRKIDERHTTLERKIEEMKVHLMERVNALFDRKFFRAIGVIIGGGVPAMTVPTALLQKTSLGIFPVIAVVFAISAVILLGTFLATRTHR
jgi:chromosome segregation ATPase